jgi:phosphoglucosamine mutase
MSRKYFGTDGIRGIANRFPMTAEMALKIAMASACVLKSENPRHKRRAIIGKDTRLSGYMLEQAMTSGFLAMGMDVILVGPIPTPGIALLTRSLRADLGVMISASHNPYQDNGIKLFGCDGYKLSDGHEMDIEAMLDSAELNDALALPDQLGQATRMEDALGRYSEFVKGSLPRGLSLEGLKIVVDCANGAGYKVAPTVLWELGADVVSIGVTPNGRNINDNCGATATNSLQQAVVAEKADIGIALDGDADRLIIVDETGTRIDGDQIMAAVTAHMASQNGLRGGGLVATVMSNLGLERFLQSRNLQLFRTAVGDRYVVEEMRQRGCNIGGEQSGHIILGDVCTTGDGLLAALQVLALLKLQNRKASEALKLFEPVPQVLKNLRLPEGIAAKSLLQKVDAKTAIAKAERALSKQGRVLVRPSGTEPVIRVMAEGDDASAVQTVLDELCDTLSKTAQA